MKHILLIISVLFVSQAFAWDFKVGDLYFNILSLQDHTCETTFGDNVTCKLSGELEIPSSVKFQDIDWTVVAIGETSFAWSKLLSIKIPNTVKEIKSHAFVKCYQLKNIIIPESVETLGASVFQECTSLSSIKLPSNISKIPTYCFMDCESLKCIDFPFNIESIAYYAFYNCPSLESINFNSSPTIVDQAFTNSPNIRSIFLDSTTPPIANSSSIFSGIVYMNGTLFVPKGCKNIYSNSYPWSEFLNIEEHNFSDVDEIYNDNNTQILFYISNSGTISFTPFYGLNIIRYNNGTVRKVFIKSDADTVSLNMSD